MTKDVPDWIIASNLERENNELRDIIAAMMIKHARAGTDGHYRTVLNPDVLGAVDSSLLLIDTSLPGMVVIRYGS